MGFKRIKNKCLAMSLTVILVGGNLLLVNANENTNSNNNSIEVTNQKELNDKISSIKNEIITGNQSEEEKTINRECLNEVSYIEEKEGKTYLKLNFTNKIDEKSDLKVLVNDIEVKYETILNELDQETKTIKFQISSIEDKITIKRNVNDTNTQIQYDIALLKSTIKEENEKPQQKPEEKPPVAEEKPQISQEKPPVPQEKPVKENQSAQLTNKNNSTQKGKLNSIENNIESSDTSVSSIARESLGNISYIEEIDGKTYVQLEFVKNLSKDKEVKIFIGGNAVTYNTLSKDANNGKLIIKYEIPNVDSKTTIKCSVNNAQGESKEIEYDIIFKKDTLKFIKDITSVTVNNVDSSLNSSGSNNNNNNNNNNSNNNTNDNSKSRSNISLEKPSVSGKLSSIKTEVSSYDDDEKIGKEQLNETAYIEETNGKMYAIFDFVANMSANSNLKISVDGSEVSHTVISKNLAKGRMRIKFEIPNIYTDIEVKNYVESKKETIEYDVELLRSTLKVEKEGSTTDSNKKPSKLPQTGIGIDGSMITILGTTMVGAGALLIKKKDE